MTFTRYAIYYAPPADAAWSKWAAAWLGWDMETGTPLPHPEAESLTAEGLAITDVTETPRKYGLHATMKPPMRLAAGTDEAGLRAACTALAATRAPVTLNGLAIERLGRFLALRPVGDVAALNALAAACVTELDLFRAPAPEAELERRRAAGLTAAQDDNLLRWGYPYVLDQFRFHITLTGKRPKAELPVLEAYLAQELAPLLPRPFVIRDLALMGEAEDGRFHLVQRYALSA
ncbi:DUF1045 domain-containing protein [Tritonibacter horizontis]|uniref:Phosphonate metabolism protein n=1 Tax=Tritonibacter horizontis TaxID=1768241 RepID=A0A132C2G3_9RHOB|nr:DUF1045 domain-containing protein [Tritonibacter horizontis]KUP94442.1 hypothetical protein TRIHO_07610 [Tritonibacter horizontis]